MSNGGVENMIDRGRDTAVGARSARVCGAILRRTGGLQFLAAAITLAAPSAVGAQIPWNGTRWRIEAQASSVERHQGREGLLLRNGVAWLAGVELEDGVVHADIHMSPGLGFHGLAFRAVDGGGYEHVYVRPFTSGNPDAAQYTPVFHGVTGWQIYAGPRFGGAIDVPTDRWVHLELRVLGARAELYVDGRALVFPALQRATAPGAVGLTSSGAPARFANIVVTPGAPMLEAGDGAAAPDSVPPGIVERWWVSTPFAEARLDSLGPPEGSTAQGGGLPEGPASTALPADLRWDPLDPGVRGIANLAALRTREAGRNTVLAGVGLRVREPRALRVRFGFSDRVRVFLNGRPLYAGSDVWRSRDDKFLGTVGLHDEIVLRLEPGDNQLWLAVSEDFGGWAVTAQLLDSAGVEVVPPR
jgi:hypothetical protein